MLSCYPHQPESHQLSLQMVLESVSDSIHTRLCADLTDVTLADEDSNPTPADYVKRAILGNVAMQVAPPGGQN